MNIIVMFAIMFLAWFLVLFMFFNFQTKGMLLQLFRAKSKGAKGCLMLVNSRADAYWRAGVMDGGWVIYVDRNKNRKRLDASKAHPRRIFGVAAWETDEETNALTSARTVKGLFGRSKEIPAFTLDNPNPSAESAPDLYVRSWEVVEGHDAIKTDNLFKRIILAPSLKNNKEIIILVLLVLVLVLSGYGAYTATGTKKIATQILENITAVPPPNVV